jgi:hypothetical protein
MALSVKGRAARPDRAALIRQALLLAALSIT